MVNETKPETTSSPTKKSRRWLKILLVAVLVILILVGLAPTIISTDSVRKIAVGRINQEIEGELSIDSWSIGWLSGVQLKGISLVDQESRPVASVEAVTLDPSYLSLLGQGPELGQIIIDRPHLEIRFGPEGETNLEETVPGLELPRRKRSARRPSFDLKINNGTVTIHQPEAESLEIKNIQTQVQMVSADEPLSFQVTCDLTDSRGGGKLSAKGSIPRQNGRFELSQLQTDLQSKVTQFELGLLSPILQRAGAGLKVSGRLDGQIEGRIQGLHSVQLSGHAVCPDIHFSGAALKTDNFHVRNFAGEVDIKRAKYSVLFETIRLTSDVGTVEVRGRAGFSPEGQQVKLESMQLGGVVTGDLPKILNQLPATVRLRSGLKVTGGNFQAEYDFSRSGNMDKLVGAAVLKDLQGAIEERIVQLDKAVELGFDVSRDGENLDIGQLSLNSGFGEVSLSGKASEFDFRSRFALDELSSEMAKFIDLGKLSFAGEVLCDGNIRSTSENLDYQLRMTGSDLLVSGLGKRALREPELQLELTGSLDELSRWPKSGITIKQAQLRSGYANLNMSAQARIEPLSVTADLNFDGQLDRLWKLASVFKELPEGIQLTGDLTGTVSTIRLSPKTITCRGQSNLRNVQITWTKGATISEPEVLFKHLLSYDLRNRTLTGKQLELSLAGLKVLVDELSGRGFGVGRSSMSARGNYQADLTKLRPWMSALGKLDPKTTLSGKSRGDFYYVWASGHELLDLSSETSDLRVKMPNQPEFSEPRIKLDLKANADRQAKLLEVSQLQLESSFAQATGRVSSGLGGTTEPAKIEIQGQCDLVRLSQLVRPWKPDFPALQGSGSANMNLTGPAPKTVGPEWVQTLSGPGTVGFDPQLLNGLSVGPANIKMQVDQGYLTIGPTDIPANEGTMTIRARVGLAGKKPFLIIGEPIQLLGDVQVNPQMSDEVLKFVNPIFANNNQVSGLVNFRCDSLVIDDPKAWKQNARMSGEFSGKDLRLKSRGGLMHDLATILKLDLSAQMGQLKPVTIKLADGVVSYKDMHIVFGSLVDLSFSGKVGPGDKLDMKLGVPVLPAMLGNNRELIKYIGDQRIYLPITGTVNDPRLDVAALPKALEPLIAEALRILAIEQIGGFLEDILKPKPPTVPAPNP